MLRNFVLTQKNQKVKTEKTFSAQAGSWPGFLSGVCAHGLVKPGALINMSKNYEYALTSEWWFEKRL